MCGICVSLDFLGDFQHRSNHRCFHIQQKSEEILRRRGPDCYDSKCVILGDYVHIDFYASVLNLRGESLVSQPYIDNCGNILLWNGEMYLDSIATSECDTVVLSNMLAGCEKINDIMKIIHMIRGPFAFVYYQKNNGLLWFGRDILGRRSLLWGISNEHIQFVLSSVALEGYNWTEVFCDGIYFIDCLEYRKGPVTITLVPWTHAPSGMRIACTQPPFCDGSSFKMLMSDSTICPPITGQINRLLSQDIITSLEINETLVQELQNYPVFYSAVTQLEKHLSEAIYMRVRTQHFKCQNCIQDSRIPEVCCNHAFISILFSGGLDSVVVAALLNRYIPEDIPIDLLNVAFGNFKHGLRNKQGKSKSAATAQLHFDVPDRITGYKGFEALKRISNRQWNFVEINVTQEELENERFHRISDIIAPLSTVLDDSIGCALWFGARGRGMINTRDESVPYCSPSRVVFVGTGADELLGGYSRHRVRYNNGGWESLLDEITLELDRICTRNLGRDDRVISDHGREARFPFLDEKVIRFLCDTPINVKADLERPKGIGEKFLLRLLALRLGLKDVAFFPKRAIQFGSRIARCENSKEKGSDHCERLKKLDPSIKLS